MQNENFIELQKHISIFNVACQLNLEILDKTRNTLKVICPFCGYRNPKKKLAKMSLNFERNSYHCFECGKAGFAIGLYATLKNIDNKTAFKELLEREAFSMDKSDYVPDTNNKLADLDKRNIVYTDFLNRLKLSAEHEKKLESLGLCKSYINDYKFKTIPTGFFAPLVISHYLNKQYSLAGIPGFYQNEEFKWIFSKINGIYIPVYSSSGKIKGLSILLDEEFNGTKNIWFSSNNKINGTPAENWLTSFNVKPDTETIILTDDFITAHCLNLGLKVPIVAFSGIQNSKNIIKNFKNTNIKNIIFTLRIQDDTQKMDYITDKLISGLLAANYNVKIKTFVDAEDMYRPDILELFKPIA